MVGYISDLPITEMTNMGSSLEGGGVEVAGEGMGKKGKERMWEM